MKKYRLYISLLVLLMLSGAAGGQTTDAGGILDKVKKNFSKIRDYKVNVRIKIDVDFLKVPETTAELLYQQPDKIKLNSEGFAMLPRQGINFSPASLLNSNYASFLEKDEVLESHPCHVIKVVPLGETKEVVLSTLWVDKSDLCIRKVESSTKNSGTFTITMEYEKEMLNNYPLPSSLKFSFDINKTNLPKSITGETGDDKKGRKKKLTKGTVEVYYTGYKVNIGIPASAFEEKKKSGK